MKPITAYYIIVTIFKNKNSLNSSLKELLTTIPSKYPQLISSTTSF